MRLSDPRVGEILRWWRTLTWWNRLQFAFFHPQEWLSVVSLDQADRKARQAMLSKVFGESNN